MNSNFMVGEEVGIYRGDNLGCSTYGRITKITPKRGDITVVYCASNMKDEIEYREVVFDSTRTSSAYEKTTKENQWSSRRWAMIKAAELHLRQHQRYVAQDNDNNLNSIYNECASNGSHGKGRCITQEKKDFLRKLVEGLVVNANKEGQLLSLLYTPYVEGSGGTKWPIPKAVKKEVTS